MKIGILLGDDIGLEVVPEAVKVIKAAAAKTGLSIEWHELLIGKAGHERYGNTLPKITEDTLHTLFRLYKKANDVDRQHQCTEAIDSCFLHEPLCNRVRQVSGHLLGEFRARRAVRFHAHGIDDRVRAPPGGQVANRRARVRDRLEVDGVGAECPGAIESFGHEVDAEHA